MSFPRYPKYEDSGVEWLGEVPQNWDMVRLGQLFVERREKVSDKDYPPLSVTKSGVVPQLETAAKTDDNDNRKRVARGDFVINSRSDRNGSAGVSEYDGSVSLINTVLQPRRSVDAAFIHYLLRSEPFQQEFYRLGKGIVADLWSTSYSEMRAIHLPLPSINEQRQISHFLNEEGAAIESLVADQERLVALLQEKLLGTITRAVTKGLDPDVPMKPSGVRFTPVIPAHWSEAPLGSICSRIASGKTPLGGAERYTQSGVLFLRSQNVWDDELHLDDVAYISSEIDNELAASRVHAGDVLLNITGASLGRTAQVPDGFPAANVNQHVCVIRLRDRERAQFIAYLLKSAVAKAYFSLVQTGAARDGLNFQQIAALRVPLPPASELPAIVTHLESAAARCAAGIGSANRAITLLQERRAALISAAVTGKIDVRNLARSDAA